MTFTEHLEIARAGRKAWNEWRRENPNIEVDFSNVGFKGISFEGFDFGDHAGFRGATFEDGTRFGGATFGDFARFDGAKFGDDTRFDGATFGDDARFRGATFGDYAQFGGATFGDFAEFRGATFSDDAGFEGATFADGAGFDGAKFRDGARFGAATFGVHAGFEGATFGAHAGFEDATFADGARFGGATFLDDARFDGAMFGDGARFEGATFGDFARFDGATFEGRVHFHATRQRDEPASLAGQSSPSSQSVADEAAISSNLPEAGTYFLAIDFSRAQFLGSASFADRDFRSEGVFSATSFDTPPDFRGTKHRENLDWTGVRFSFGWYPKLGRHRIPIRGWTTKSETITRLRRLRGIARDIHAVDAERDLFILERQAERGILWRNWWHGGWRIWLTGWWRPLTATFLIFLYRYSSNCGRSVSWPAAWLVVSNMGFYFLYASLIERPLFISDKGALFDLAFASAIPFGPTARPAFQSAVEELFGGSGLIDIPWQIQAASAAQGIINLVLFFLLGLALRNYFKFR